MCVFRFWRAGPFVHGFPALRLSQSSDRHLHPLAQRFLPVVLLRPGHDIHHARRPSEVSRTLNKVRRSKREGPLAARMARLPMAIAGANAGDQTQAMGPLRGKRADNGHGFFHRKRDPADRHASTLTVIFVRPGGHR